MSTCFRGHIGLYLAVTAAVGANVPSPATGELLACLVSAQCAAQRKKRPHHWLHPEFQNPLVSGWLLNNEQASTVFAGRSVRSASPGSAISR